ncbi:MAG: hypothetical protein ACR2QA_01655 [Solirubrobacteraceae bacterium]
MKVWARYAVPVMVLVDEDEIERVVMVPGERFIDRETMGDMLFYTEQLERISSSDQEAAHALYVGDHGRWADSSEWEIEDSWDMLSMSVDERRHPNCPDCDGEGYTWPRDAGEEQDGDPCPRCVSNGFIDRELGRHPDASVVDAG